MGVADLISDGIAYARLGEVALANYGYKAAYVAILCFGAVTTAVALAYRLHIARLVKANLLELGEHARIASSSEAQRQVQQHEWELVRTFRTKMVLSLSLLTILAQGAVLLRAVPLATNVSSLLQKPTQACRGV